MPRSKTIFDYTVQYGTRRHTYTIKRFGTLKHYCERRAVESIVVHDIVPVFTGETIEEVEAFLNTRSKKTRDKKPYKANPDSVVNVFI